MVSVWSDDTAVHTLVSKYCEYSAPKQEIIIIFIQQMMITTIVCPGNVDSTSSITSLGSGHYAKNVCIAVFCSIFRHEKASF